MLSSLTERCGASCKEVARFYKEQDALDYEVERIAQYKCGILLNATCGGDGGRERTGCSAKFTWNLAKESLSNALHCISLSENGIYMMVGSNRLHELANHYIETCSGLFGRDIVDRFCKEYRNA